MTEPRISVCIVCRNEADRLGPCLESVAWADEILVMDLDSTDGSAELAMSHGARVLRRAPVPIVELVRNEVAAEAAGEWILVLDPDERITPGLARELRALAGRDDLDAVVIPRMNYDLGYPPSNPYERYEPQLRMYRRSRVAWPTIPNKLPQVPEERRHQIPGRDELVMVHDRSRNVPEILDRSLRYAPLQAQSMIDRGEVFTARSMLASLGSRAYRQLVLGKAWRDGVPGLLRVGILVGFHFYVWTAFWQLSGARRTPEDDRFVRRLGRFVEGARRVWRAGTAPWRWGKRLLRAARR
ncbi:MAG TPA: glycosyltransferase family 2 protein [Thermoanaerobaculia bacterium]|jgi:glycosyltransferase involved in cell wall biosynthesis|nr:glycosyltransferase family 2 protein [Thermoanaerobaculia bacterium]